MTAMDGTRTIPPRLPGAYWREVLADAVEVRGTHWSLSDLLRTVADCDASLVDVAGWLCDELSMGRVQHVVAWPQHYELVPGVRLHHHRMQR
jgi:hypothetical protein